MSTPTHAPNADFQARLDRISRGDQAAPEGLIVAQRPEPKDVKLTGGLFENALYPLSLVGAFTLGLLAVFFSRFARVHLIGGADPETDVMLSLIADGGMALAIGFVFKQGFRMEGAEWISAQTAGVTVMVAGMHNLVHLYPGLFSLMFTRDWVELVISYTEFRTLMLAGNALPF